MPPIHFNQTPDVKRTSWGVHSNRRHWLERISKSYLTHMREFHDEVVVKVPPRVAHAGRRISPTRVPSLRALWVNINGWLSEVKAQGHEGLVLKKKGSIYWTSAETSIITPDWLKLKVPVDV